LPKAVHICLQSTLSIAGVLLLLITLALSVCAVPVLLLALFWLG